MPIEIIEVPDGAANEVVHRVPASGSGEFKFGAQVIVRESQTAIFFRDGQALDVFGAGRHTLSTMNLPLITHRLTDRVFGESPFKAEVYFVNQHVFVNIKWGTRDPIAYRDQELAIVRLRAHGEMAIRVSDPMVFVNKVVGVRGLYTQKDIDGFFKAVVLSTLAQVIGGELKSIFDLPVRYGGIATATKALLFDEFAAYGTELVDLVIESITPPEEVQTRIDERSAMGAVGNLDSYLRYKSALAIEEAATHGGGAGNAMDTAAGLGLGLSVMRSVQEGLAPPPANSVQSAVTTDLKCGACGQTVPVGSRFCLHCGTSLLAALCMNCQQPLVTGAKFCASCGHPAPRNAEGSV